MTDTEITRAVGSCAGLFIGAVAIGLIIAELFFHLTRNRRRGP